MKKNKGFTLIELLAVIVILAVIALIATPIIMNVINGAKEGATKDTLYGYVKAVELATTKLIGTNTDAPTGTFVTSEGNLYLKEKEIAQVNASGTKPENNGTVTLLNGQVVEANLTVDGFTMHYDGTKITNNTYTKYADGTVVYYNPETDSKCTAAQANSETGTKTGCMKWYTFHDDVNSSRVNLILDHNSTATVAWNSDNSNKVMKEAATALANDSVTWNQNLSPRLISADEIAQITGNKNWKSRVNLNWFVLQDNSQNSVTMPQGGATYKWLFDNTNGCISYGCSVDSVETYGYWSSSTYMENDKTLWIIHLDGRLMPYDAERYNAFGIRPVISVPKSVIA